MTNAEAPTLLSRELGALEHPAARIAIPVVIGSIAIFVLHDLASHVRWTDVRTDPAAVRPLALLAALGCTVISLVGIAAYDTLALRPVAQRAMPARVTMIGGAAGYAISGLLGVSSLTGTAVGWRVYSSFGLDLVKITAIVAAAVIVKALISNRAPVGEPREIPAAVRRRVAESDDTEGNMALTVDKLFLVSPDEKAFVAYADTGTSLIAKGDPDGRIVAFANLAQGSELSLDLMRYLPDAPHFAMDARFAEMMLWGRAQGYRWMSLGTAPFAGVVNRAFAPLWNRIGRFFFEHGEHFYNFEGLRAFKEKFDPVWTPNYLACPGGLAAPRILYEVNVLVSGGLRGLMK